MDAEHGMSAGAASRMQAMLPSMLEALRGRVRRAQRRRAAVACAALVASILLVVWLRPPAQPSPAPVPGPVAAASGWVQLHDDPQVLARCELATVARASWWVGDDELQTLLREADRPPGLVRVGERVFVGVGAIDPWPDESP